MRRSRSPRAGLTCSTHVTLPSRCARKSRRPSRFSAAAPCRRQLCSVAFNRSKAARDWFGEDFVYHFAASREWEEREFRKHITDWELARYFEII